MALTLEQIISDDEIEKAWGNAKFGDTPKRDVIAGVLLKRATGYHCGYTAQLICIELRLISAKSKKPTVRGKFYLYWYFQRFLNGEV